MAVLSAAEIYAAAREAGFDPHQAVTWTAIALAESSGRTDAHAGSGEDSWGLWQINIAPGVRSNPWGDLTDPANNARAAYEISRQGTDMSPWTVTHDSRKGTNSDYRQYLDEAQAAAGGIAGDARGARGYGDHGDGSAAPSYDAVDGGAPLALGDTDQDGLTDDFERVAGTDVRVADTDRDGLSDGYEAATTHTDPLSADTDRDRVSDAVEVARGSDAGQLAGVAGVAGAGQFRESVRGGVADADRDGLSDRYEKLIGTDARAADTDRDRLSDSVERSLGLDPRSADSDRDGLTDFLEQQAGGDPLHAPGMAGAPPGGATVPATPATGSATATTSAAAAFSAAGPAQPAVAPGWPTGAAPESGDRVHRFVEAALAQRGDRYIFGAETRLSDPNPERFDCSELTQWAAHQAGVTLPDGASAQYLAMKQQGALIPVEQASHTPGALLFSFSREPVPGGGRPSQAHVAISLGNGKTIEAASPADGVRSFSVGNRFDYAAVIPGLQAPGTGVPSYDAVDGGAPLALGDTDQDGLTDDFERVAGTDVRVADTDRDGLSDGYEAATTHTDPLSADTDRDRVSDAVEVARGSDAGQLAGVAGVAGAGQFRESVRGGVADADRDGLSDRYEKLIGTDARAADTDRDRLSDSVERSLGLDPRSADSDRDGLTDFLEQQAGGDPLHAPGMAGVPPGRGLPGQSPLGTDPAGAPSGVGGDAQNGDTGWDAPGH